MQEEGTQYRQRPSATRPAAARMLSTVPSCTVGVNPAARHISTVNWLNSGARASSASRAELVTRLNVQVSRHAPGTRFITLFYGVYDPRSGELTYVNAGHMPPIVLRAGDAIDRLSEGGMALGMLGQSTYATGHTVLQPEELLAVYSDGITEAENPAGQPFDEQGLESALVVNRRSDISAIGAAVVRAVEAHTADTRLADDLTILLLRRSIAPAPAGV